MPLNPLRQIRLAFDRKTLSQNLMFVFCVLFGMAIIAQTQSPADGGWFWYATLFHRGRRLYADMHLALQPVFVLETAAFLTLLGKGWLVSKVPAILHVVSYCIALRILIRYSDFSDGQKAIILGCGFFFPITFEAYRFDDYHVLADCLQLYSLVILLLLQKAPNLRIGLLLASVLGILSGLAITTRLNDGAALLVGVALGILCLAPSKRLLSLALFSLATGLTIVLIVSLTGDSLHNYASYSIFRAAGSKGGAGSVLVYPIRLPFQTLRWLRINRFEDLLIAYVFAMALSWVFLLRPLARRRGPRELAMAATGILLVFFLMLRMYRTVLDNIPVASFSAIAVLFACGLGVLVPVRLLRWLSRSVHPYVWDPREILLLIPVGQLASGSMSSGGVHLGLYGPIGVLIVLLSICSPFQFKAQWPRSCLIAVATLLLCSAAIYKFNDPFSWHTYREQPLFTGRTWYRHPDYGPMIIDKDLLNLIEPVCKQIGPGGPQNNLVSLPFSYANYFCSTPPWHDYVQTFFDTSSKQTIQTLMDELQASPPQWIFYQRQLDTLRLHEIAYNRGQPLQQRYLDQLIEQKIAEGAWHVVFASDYGNSATWSNHWLLIKTK